MDENCNCKMWVWLIVVIFIVYLLRSKIIYVLSVLGESAQHFSTQYNSAYIDSGNEEEDDDREEKPKVDLNNKTNKKLNKYQ